MRPITRLQQLLFLLLLLQPTPLLAQSTLAITVSLTDATYGADIVGMNVQFSDESGQLAAACTTNDEGECNLLLPPTPTNDTVRGKLDFGAFGTRSLIFRWQDGDFTVDLQTDSSGKIIVPGHHQHPTLSAENLPLTPLPPSRPQTTPTTVPTLEYVILDPYSFTPPPSTQPLDLIVDTVTTPVATQAVANSAENQAPIAAIPDTATEQPAQWPLYLCSGLFIAIWVSIIVSVRQNSRQPEERFHV